MAPTDEAEERWKWWFERYFQSDSDARSRWLDVWAGGQDSPTTLGVEHDGLVCLDEVVPQPKWLVWLCEVQGFANRKGSFEGSGSRPIEAVIGPFVEFAARRVDQTVSEHRALSPAEHAIILKSARLWLTTRLEKIAAPATAVAMNAARLMGQLVGDNSEARLEDFGRRVARWPDRASLLGYMPVLDRLLAQVSMDTTEAIEECISHFLTARTSNLSLFGDTPTIAEIRFGLGDPHRSGRTVASFSFQGGKKVVYKPHSVGNDVAFRRFLCWVGTHIPAAPSPTVAVDCGEHGWVGFVEPAECSSEADVRDAYYKTGVLIAAFDLCGGSDLHYENLIYAGSNPVIVDLETVLWPKPKHPDAVSQTTYDARAQTMLRTGYLPGGSFFGKFRRDVSAAALHDVVSTPFPQPYYDDEDGETLGVRSRPYVIEPADNCPVLAGRRQPASQFLEEISQGIRDATRLFVEKTDQLAAPGGPLDLFKDVEVRWVARGTAMYSQALMKSYHPAHMRDGFDHEMAYAILSRRDPAGGARADMLRGELEDLWRCDIPIFTTRSGSLDAQDGAGRIIPDVFKESAYQVLCNRVAHLQATDAERSISTMLCAFSAVADPVNPHPTSLHKRADPAEAGALLEAAESIGETIARDAYWVDGIPFWVVPQNCGPDARIADITNFDLYQGVSGVGVFFAELARATGSAEHRAFTEGCRRGARLAMQSSDRRIGGFNGLGGLLYADLRMSGGLDGVDSELTSQVLSRISELACDDVVFDVIGGSAGALLSIANLSEVPWAADQARTLCGQLADRLVAGAVWNEDSAYWRPPAIQEPSTGFAHGSAGIALALAVASRILDTTAYDSVLNAAIRHVRLGKGDGTGSGPHHAGEGSASASARAARVWCYGSAGITLALQRLSRLRPDLSGELEDQIVIGLATTTGALAGGNDAICHGVMGNIEPFLNAGGEEQQVARSAASAALQRARVNGWRCSVGDRNVGLMLGLAGIGHQLLRVGQPDIPSVLTLDSRIRNTARNEDAKQLCAVT